MPEFVGSFLPTAKLLSYDAISRIVGVLVRAGVDRVRLTGGEPLMRPGLSELVARLSRIDGLHQIALTTNGMLLADQLGGLVAAGLTHINISLDTLRESAFRQMSRRDGLDRVLQGIEAAMGTAVRLRLNALILRDINGEDCLPLVRFARERGLVIRFIEFMPLDADRSWSHAQVVTGREIRQALEGEFGPLLEAPRGDASQPSRDFLFADGRGGVGFIDPVSEPFCGDCNRLRLTADGKFRNCLFGREEWDVKSIVDGRTNDEAIYRTAMECVLAKFAAHGISEDGFVPPQRSMYQIGG